MLMHCSDCHLNSLGQHETGCPHPPRAQPASTPPLGWMCPRCMRCYAPFVGACGACGPVTFTSDSTTVDIGSIRVG